MKISLPYCPFQYQQTFHSDPARYRVVAAGRRSGKSLSALHELLRHCISTPDANALWISPSLKDCRDIAWVPLKELFEDLAPVISKTNETRMQIIFTNGSKLTCKGAENEKSLRGRGYTFVVLDECAFLDRTVWTRAIRPALSDRKGKAILCSTPLGRNNWFYDIFTEATKKQNWSAYRWLSQDSPLMTPEEMEDARGSLAESEYKQEYESEFISHGGLVYSNFGDSNILPPFSPSRETHNIYMSMDPGYQTAAIGFYAIPRLVDNTSSSFASVKVFQFDEIYARQKDIQVIISDIARTLDKHGLTTRDVRTIAIDPAANKIEQTSGISIPALLREAGYRPVERGSLVRDGIALVKSFILAANGTRRFFVTSNCTESIRSYLAYQYRIDNREIPTDDPLKDSENDHAGDQLRYFFLNKFDLGIASFRFLRMASNT